jgi:hypothetical protein
MIKFKPPGALAFLSILSLAQSPAFGDEGRQIAAPPWSAACMTDILVLRLTSREAGDE